MKGGGALSRSVIRLMLAGRSSTHIHLRLPALGTLGYARP